MQSAGICPDSFTYTFALKACAALSSLPQGKRIHGQIVVRGFESHVFVITAVIDMYVKCSSIEDARQVFDKMRCRDVVSWNAMIAGYAQHGRANEALVLFYKMRCEDVMPELATMVHVLPAFAELGNLRLGKCVHEYIVRNGFGLDRFVGSSLIDMYARCGGIEVARQLFDKMSQRDAVSWTAMIAGYAQNGYAWKALTLFHQMLREKIMPNSATIASAISACGDIGALEQGKWIHDYISKKKLELDVFVATSLIDMYAKCGSLEVARQLFDKMVERDVVSWNCMIAGYGLHGHGKDALELFFQMQGMGVKPNNITFNNILSACRRAHLVDEACQFFDCMTQNYHIEKTLGSCNSSIVGLGISNAGIKSRCRGVTCWFKFGKSAEGAGVYGNKTRQDFDRDDVEQYFNYMGMLAVEGTYDKMEALLNKNIPPIDILLLLAASEGDKPKIEELMQAGADYTVTDVEGRTALDRAVDEETKKLISKFPR